MTKRIKVIVVIIGLLLTGIVSYIFATLFKSELESSSKEAKSKKLTIKRILEKEGKRMKLPEDFDVRFRRDKESGRFLSRGPANTEDLKRLARESEVDDLFMKFSEITYEGITSLKNEPLRRLELFQPQLGKDALKGISELTTLKNLELKSVRNIDDQSIMKLKGPEGLKVLSIVKSNIGDRGLSHIALTFKRLECLQLRRNNKMTGTGFKGFSNSTSLRKLNVIEQKLKREVYRYISRIKSLRHLELKKTGLKDTDIKVLSKMNLNFLDISGNRLTDKSLDELGKMRSLLKLVCRDCNSITRDGIKNFIIANKNCKLSLGSETVIDLEKERKLTELLLLKDESLKK